MEQKIETATVYRDNGKENGNYEPKDCILGEWNRKWTLLQYIGIMEKSMEPTIAYSGYIGIMDKQVETTNLKTAYWENGTEMGLCYST